MGYWRDLRRALAGRREQRVAEFGSSSIPGPLEGGIGSYSNVDLRRAESSLQAGAVWAATNLVARVLSSLPIDTYRRSDDVPKQIGNPQLIEDPGGEDYGRKDWLYQYLMCQQLRGNAVGKLGATDRTTGYPAQIVLFHPDDAFGWRDRATGAKRWRIGGRELTPAEVKLVWHRRSYPMPGSLMGMSPVEQQAGTIGQNLAAARFGLQFFTDGGHPTQVLKNTEASPTPAQSAQVKTAYLAAVHGTREPVVIGKAWDIQNLQVRPEEAQMLETLGFSSADCARIFGAGLPEILGYETGGSLTYSNRVDRATDLLTFTFDPWLVQIEDMFTKLLPRGQYVKFNRSALLRMTTAERWKVYQIQLATKARVINEVRHDEDWAPVEWGDEPVQAAAEAQPSADEIADKVKEKQP